jgi:hypothetical protein
MSEYGYIPEAPEQSAFNNKGIFKPKDIYNLDQADKWTPQLGQLELIETQTVDDSDFSESIIYLDFTNLGDYDVHFLVYSDFQTQGYGYPSVRFSNNGGSSFISASYQYAYFSYYNTSSFQESRSTSADTIRLNHNQYQNMNGYVYLYNLLDSSKYSFTTNHSSNVAGNNVTNDMSFGSGVYPSAEVHNAIRFRMNNDNPIGALKVSLYGIKEYS